MIDMPFPAFDPHNSVASPNPYVYQVPEGQNAQTDFLEDKYETYMAIIDPIDDSIKHLYEVAQKNRLTVEQVDAFQVLLNVRGFMIKKFNLLDYKDLDRSSNVINDGLISKSYKPPHPQDD